MCGINLIIDKNKKLSPGLIERMSFQTQHRGPDETKSLKIEAKSYYIYLASNRLKITDQSAAASQPMITPDSKFALLFNGEIYNFHTLKNELINGGISFSSHSDTELLFRWLILYGREGIEKLEGMFAFVFIDIERDEILVVRDRYGIKPIYYFEDENCLIVSSEIKPIIESGLVKKEINTSQIRHYLAFKYVKKPETFFQNIYELEQGTILWHLQSKSQISHFHNINHQFNDAIPDANKIENLITDSLLQQLNTKVPLGLLLSGGVDSTLILALAKKEGYSVPTYTIINTHEDRSFGTKDYKYSRMASTAYGSDHHELEMNISILEQFDDFIEQMDQPIGDSAYLMTSEICKNASDPQFHHDGEAGMKILLSGAGADEYFGGYNRHWAYYNYLKHKKILDITLPILKPSLNLLPSGFAHPLRKKFKLIKKWSKSFDQSPKKTFLNYLTFDEFKLSLNEFNDLDNGNSNLLSWALECDQNNYLVSDVLALSDKASMRHGLEVRLPYLDEKLTAYLSTINSNALMEKGQKWVLKNILEKHGGKKFINRPKEGFGMPLSSWLFDKRVAHLWEIFESKDSLIFQYFEKKKFDYLVNQQKQNVEDHGPLLWSILVLAHWLQHNFSSNSL